MSARVLYADALAEMYEYVELGGDEFDDLDAPGSSAMATYDEYEMLADDEVVEQSTRRVRAPRSARSARGVTNARGAAAANRASDVAVEAIPVEIDDDELARLAPRRKARPELRVVDDAPRRRRQRVRVATIAGMVVTVVILFGVVVLNGVLAENQYSLERLEQRREELLRDNQELVLVDAQLRAPNRIVDAARRLGLEPASAPQALTVPAGDTTVQQGQTGANTASP